MASLLYRCPNTGLQVQGWLDDTPDTELGKESYQGERCPACGKLHFVNAKSGKILGVDEE
jgi:hypothetical protein